MSCWQSTDAKVKQRSPLVAHCRQRLSLCSAHCPGTVQPSTHLLLPDDILANDFLPMDSALAISYLLIVRRVSCRGQNAAGRGVGRECGEQRGRFTEMQSQCWTVVHLHWLY